MSGPRLLALLAAAVALSAVAGEPPSRDLPFCANRTIRQVARRAGCTLADDRCWRTSGGFCTDWIEQLIRTKRGEARRIRLSTVAARDVSAGDVAVFLDPGHYAWVENVRRDARGAAVAVDLSEYNRGTCWVEKDLMVTDRFKALDRRTGVPLTDVDGGFLRPRHDDR
jgi:hypothetical protein